MGTIGNVFHKSCDAFGMKRQFAQYGIELEVESGAGVVSSLSLLVVEGREVDVGISKVPVGWGVVVFAKRA